MRVLILGGTGMLGHTLHDVLSREHDVLSTTRSPLGALPVDGREFFGRGRVVEGVEATDLELLRGLIAGFAPAAVINCVGVIKQRDAAHDPTLSVAVNALLPHQMATLCAERGSRFIHFSTDCVFSGSKGDYMEDDPSDATDLYGRTKYLGEVTGAGALTIRSSIIGRELDHFRSLVEWFLSQRGEIRGFTGAIYTGVTTAQMGAIVGRLLVDHPSLDGLYQIASEKINKFELLRLMRDRFGLQSQVQILPDDAFLCDRSLDGSRFAEATGIEVPSWPAMIDGLADDAGRYRRVTT
jgi:dTDP-4-dehydrorhamnose reductase